MYAGCPDEKQESHGKKENRTRCISDRKSKNHPDGRVFIWMSHRLYIELVSSKFADVEVELTCLRIYGKFFAAGAILQIYTAAYTALAMANSSETRVAVRAIMLALMLSLVNIIAILLLRTISLVGFTIRVLRTQTETFL